MNTSISRGASGKDADKLVVSKAASSLSLLKKHRILILCITTLMLVVGAGVVLAQYEERKIDVAKVRSLMKNHDCNKNALNAVKNEKPDPKQLDGSIDLLSYKAFCYDSTQQYAQAIAVNTKLKYYYKLSHNANMVNSISTTISYEEYNLANPTRSNYNPKAAPVGVNPVWSTQASVKQ